MELQLAFKKKLYQHALQIIQERIAASELAMRNAQAAANSEEKSSAGDKYETSRAMSHLEKHMQSRQLLANQNELEALLAINCNSIHQLITVGTVVVFKEFQFFIAAGLGKIMFDNKLVYLISPHAPIAKALAQKQVGNEIIFNKKVLTIEALF